MNLKIFQQLTAELNLEARPKPIVLPPHQYTRLKHLLGAPKSSKEVYRLLMGGGIRIYPKSSLDSIMEQLSKKKTDISP